MHKSDRNRVVFHSKEDMAGGYNLSKGEHILRNDDEPIHEDINDVLELYNIKLYIDNEVFLKSWSETDINRFKQKVIEYGKIVGRFISQVDDRNVLIYHENLFFEYVKTFWRLVNNQKAYKQISGGSIKSILTIEPHQVRTVLTNKDLVSHYNLVLRELLMSYSQSAEILLSVYEVRKDFNHEQVFIPKGLSIADKEEIISNYIDSEEANLNYYPLIQNSRTRNDFKLSDKTRLKAKRKHEEETKKMFQGRSNDAFMKYGVSITYPENADKIKDGHIEDLVAHYAYSIDFIKQNANAYLLYLNFKLLFEYLDNQNRINLVSKPTQLGVFERVMGVHSQNEYVTGFGFSLSEMTSQAQIFSYSKIVSTLGHSLENILQYVFTTLFAEKYNFPNNARLSMPNLGNSAFEKVRLLAPELESVLKQYKLFVFDGHIDFELLQISSAPSSMKEMPSLNENKYIYLNTDNKEVVGCSNLFFSDQTLLAYVDPFKEKHYQNLFELLANEEVCFTNYEEHQKPELNYLIEKGYIQIDEGDYLQLTNVSRVLILKDIHDNDVASMYHYPLELREEANHMFSENMLVFESTLLSKPEQDYFNFHLNKSEFTNGFDLRNSYLHGTQANPEEIEKHENAYFIYLKLLTLVLLKIEDDLLIYQLEKSG